MDQYTIKQLWSELKLLNTTHRVLPPSVIFDPIETDSESMSIFSHSLPVGLWTTGSERYGIATNESDIDVKGVFLPCKDNFYGFQQHVQFTYKLHTPTKIYDIQMEDIRIFLKKFGQGDFTNSLIARSAENCFFVNQTLLEFLDSWQHTIITNTFKNAVIGYAADINTDQVPEDLEKARKSLAILQILIHVHQGGNVPVPQHVKEKIEAIRSGSADYLTEARRLTKEIGTSRVPYYPYGLSSFPEAASLVINRIITLG